MPDLVLDVLVRLAQGLEIIGAGALVLGFAIASVRFVRGIAGTGLATAYGGYRRAIGRVVVIGLEILVAATIIKTITVAPSLEGLGLLGLMIVIRTILSWTTVLEMSGRWPWQRAPASSPPPLS